MFPRLTESLVLKIAERATMPHSGRVGTNPALQPQEAVWLAVAAYAAYGHLGLTSREEAYQSQDQVQTLLRTWGGPEPTEVLRPSLRG
jgi:hypothetical protein